MEADEKFTCRRAESADAQGVGKLIKRHTESLFGRIDPEYIIEHASLSISLLSVDTHGEVVGHMSLFDSPQVYDQLPDQNDWLSGIHRNYNYSKVSPVNCLFVGLFVSKDGFQLAASSELIRTVFIAVPLLQYIFLSVNQGTKIGSALEKHFSKVPGVDETEQLHDLYVTHRQSHFPMLYIRGAIVEDTDDLMAVLSQHSAGINQKYGDYFLSELIASQDDQHKTVAAEVNGLAIGLISVTTVIDMDLLSSAYQLEAYHDLRRPSNNDYEMHSTFTEGNKTEIKPDSHSQQTEVAQEKCHITTTPASITHISSPRASAIRIGLHRASITRNGTSQASTAHIGTPQDSTAHITKSPLASTAHIGTPQASTSHIGTPQDSTAHITKSPLASTAHIGTPQASTSHIGTPRASTAHIGTPQASTSHIGTPRDSTAHVTKSPLASTAHIGTPQASTAHIGTPRDSTAHVTKSPLASTAHIGTPPADQGKVDGKLPEEDRGLMGLSNALAVQLFAIDEEYEMRSIDFLQAVFKLFPNHDFIVLTQPHSIREFPLLAHFTRVPPHSGTCVPHDLYIMHKCSLLHSFAVSPLTREDLPRIQHLVAGLQGQRDILSDVAEYISAKRDKLDEGATPVSVVVAKCADQVVGVAVLRDEKEIDYICSHYNIEDFVYFNYHRPFEHAHLYHLILSPAFSTYAKHFIKEVLRLTRKTCLYYRLFSEDMSPNDKPHTIINTLQYLVPVRPRKQIVYPDGEVLGVNAPLPEVTKVNRPYALYHTSRKLTFEPKICINSKVLVVGGSETALSLLETLVFCPHLHFTNITLVSPDGLRQERSGSSSCSSRKLELLGLGTWVNTVPGKVVGINRSDQCVDVETKGSKFIVYYDWLLLTCGLQYNPPCLNGIPPPKGVLSALVDPSILDKRDYFVVYGNCLDSYHMVDKLLSSGVTSDRITLIQPDIPTCFGDEVISKRVDEAVSNAGVQVLTGYSLSGWKVSDEILSGVQVVDSSDSRRTVDCTIMVYMGEKTVDSHAFKAFNDACLVFDNRLVIDSRHLTNDNRILAAGPVTKFSRKYRVDDCSHSNFNSEEVGQRLATSLLSKLDPTAAAPDEEDPVMIPPYMQPNVCSCTLPGGLSCLYITAPPIPGDQNKATKGRELVTNTSNGYFKLCISRYGCVDGLSVLSGNELMERDNYISLYNVHEKYFNNLMSRFDQNLITDFFTYFREPWACALFFDRFPDFLQEVREYLSLLPEEDGVEGSLEDRIRAVVEGNPNSTLTAVRSDFGTHFEPSAAKRLITERLFQFLQYNKQQLPMYARQDMI